MRGCRFRLKTRILALERPEGQTSAVYLHPGDVIKVIDDPSNGDALIDVEWSGRTVMMFYRDLLENGEQVSDAAGDV
jgi:hypothetical protein